MNARLKFALALSVAALAAQASAQVTFYENEGFQGRSFTTNQQVMNFNRFSFNDRASSVIVTRNRWEVCEDVRFTGRCVVLRPGNYASLASMGLNDRVSSVRVMGRNANIDEQRYGPSPVADYSRRDNERLSEARVTSVRAVLGTPEQRCWVERENYVKSRNDNTVPGAIVGGLLGGILGHQVGGGAGKDLATVGGAVAGAAVGANVARNNSGEQMGTRDVQRCENQPNQAKPAYWDVTYNFRGQEHQVQMTSAPGATVRVNEQGEPRL
jgi:uncharacterized protein YcfJ